MINLNSKVSILFIIYLILLSCNDHSSFTNKKSSMKKNLIQEYSSMPLSQRLHIILLGVKDVQKSSRFYDSLGWVKAEDSHSGFVKYDLGGYAIALISKEDFAKDALYPSSHREGFPGVAFIYLAKTENDVQKILNKAVESGGELVKPATRTPYGVAGYFRDPDGHLFEADFEEKFEFTNDYKLITK